MARKTVIATLLFACALGIGMNVAAFGAEPGSLQFTKKGHVVCGDIFSVPEGTIEFWINPASTANNEWVLAKNKEKANAMEFGFGLTTVMHMVKRNGEWTYVLFDTKIIPVNQWTHVACTFNKEKATLFINGVAKNVKKDDFSIEHLAGGEFTIGKGTQRQFFRGLIAEMRLSSAIRYTGAFVPSKTPFQSDAQTVALYHFGDEDEGETVSDAGPQGLHGKIVGTVTRSKESPFTK